MFPQSGQSFASNVGGGDMTTNVVNAAVEAYRMGIVTSVTGSENAAGVAEKRAPYYSLVYSSPGRIAG